MKTIENNKNLMSRLSFSKKINIGLDTLRKWEKEGKITFIKIGTQVRYRFSDVQYFLKNISNDVENDQFLSRKELADRWGFCIETLKRWEKAKKLPFIKIGKQVRYLLSEVEKIEKI
jgi:excisionase family DNA binding protein